MSTPRFINPHRLFHGVWIPQWLEERPEVSEKAKKLYAYLTYFAGNKGYAWPSFRVLSEKLHCSRRHVVRVVQELSAHRLIEVTNVSNPTRGHCSNYYRFLSHPWMQTKADADFVLPVEEDGLPFEAGDPIAVPPDDDYVTSSLVTSSSLPPGDNLVTSPVDMHVTPLVTPMSPLEENKKKRLKGERAAVRFSKAGPAKPASLTASPPPKVLSDTTKIILERRIAELRKDIVIAVKRGDHAKAGRLHAELAQHQTTLGFFPDDPPHAPKPDRGKSTPKPVLPEESLSSEEIAATFQALRRSAGLPTRQ